MKPKKLKDLIPDISKDIQTQEELVSDVLDFYWYKIRKTLEDPPNHVIKLDKLGYFKARFNLVEKYRLIYEKLLVKYNEKNYNSFHMYERIIKRLKKYKKLKESILNDHNKKQTKKEEKKTYKRSLEESSQDSTGDKI